MRHNFLFYCFYQRKLAHVIPKRYKAKLESSVEYLNIDKDPSALKINFIPEYYKKLITVPIEPAANKAGFGEFSHAKLVTPSRSEPICAMLVGSASLFLFLFLLLLLLLLLLLSLSISLNSFSSSGFATSDELIGESSLLDRYQAYLSNKRY